MAEKLLVIIMTVPPVILEITTFSSPKEEKETSINADFTEYLWMENEEQFEEEVMKQLEEEALMDECVEAMLEEEMMLMELNAASDLQGLYSTDTDSNGDILVMSMLNPDAAEFIPKTLE